MRTIVAPKLSRSAHWSDQQVATSAAWYTTSGSILNGASIELYARLTYLVGNQHSKNVVELQVTTRRPPYQRHSGITPSHRNRRHTFPTDHDDDASMFYYHGCDMSKLAGGAGIGTLGPAPHPDTKLSPSVSMWHRSTYPSEHMHLQSNHYTTVRFYCGVTACPT